MQKKLSAVASTVFTGILAMTAVTPANAGGDVQGPETYKPDEAKTYVTASIASAHFGHVSRSGDYNNFNPGLGFERVSALGDNGGVRFGVSAGLYLNSIDRVSAFVAGQAELCSSPRNTFTLCAGAMAGAVTGYRTLPVAPAFVPFAKLEHNPSGIFGKLMVIPPIGDAIPGTVGLQAGLRF